jgi:hypothetical protein
METDKWLKSCMYFRRGRNDFYRNSRMDGIMWIALATICVGLFVVFLYIVSKLGEGMNHAEQNRFDRDLTHSNSLNSTGTRPEDEEKKRKEFGDCVLQNLRIQPSMKQFSDKRTTNNWPKKP